MLVAATVCPHPPVLVPAVANGAAHDLEDLRVTCLDAVRWLASLGADVVVVGGAAESGEWDSSAGGSLRAFGVEVSYGGPEPVLPLSLTIGAFLLDQVGHARAPRRYVAVADGTSAKECAAFGAELVTGERPVALLVMGDGSAKRTTTSPGYFDERAVPYDAAVVAALEKADTEALLTLTPGLADQLWVAGRPAWQVLAGAAQAAGDDGASVSAVVQYDEAPYGVGYAVVEWGLGQS